MTETENSKRRYDVYFNDKLCSEDLSIFEACHAVILLEYEIGMRYAMRPTDEFRITARRDT